MSRSIRVIGVGVSLKNGKAYARGVVDFEPAEQNVVLQLANKSDVVAPQAAFGMINGLPEQALAKLQLGDVITADKVEVFSRLSTFEVVVNGATETRTGIDCSLRVSGNASRAAAPVATCDW